MDAIWDCMNIASRISKQVESMDGLVPKHQQQTMGITPTADLQELATTINSVRSTLVPFVTSSKKSKAVSELPAFEICLKGIKLTLNDLHIFFKDLEKEFSVYTWKTQKVKLYQIDFLLRQKLDQFSVLFNVNGLEDSSNSKDDKSKNKNGNTNDKLTATSSYIADPEGRDMWVKCFGEATLMVPWNIFFSTFESYLGMSLKDDEESLKMFLNFTKTDHVSLFEFATWIKWFGPFKFAYQRMVEAIHGGLLGGFVPAVEANLLLEGKRDGTYLIRCSKTVPGSFAVTFVDHTNKVKHCLLYSVSPSGLTLKNPPTVYQSLKEFADSHTNKLKHPLGNKWTLKNKLAGFAYDGRIPGETESRNNNNNNNNGSSPGPSPSSPSVARHSVDITQEKPANNSTNGLASGMGSGMDSNLCVVCMDSPLETVFLECGHLACCQKCSAQLKNCPICRNVITRVIPIFRVN